MADENPPINEQKPTAGVIVRSLIFAAVFYLITALFLILGSWLLLAPRKWAMAGLKLHGRTCVWLLKVICGTDIEVRGRQHLEVAGASGILAVSKHQSAWDTFALIPLFNDPAIVLKDELKLIPLYGWFCVKFQHILVKREKASMALKSLIAAARDRVQQGREILIFPEGTRTAPGAEPDYKPGYVALYEALQVPVVPIALNSGVYWRRRSLWRYPGTIVVACLPPIPPGLPRSEFRSRLENALETECASLLHEALKQK
jgi:1-acyl-sn-glycerol-3-phosphate acyltransferase